MTEASLESASGRGAIRVQLTCASGDDLVKILDDAAGFMRQQAGRYIEEEDEDLELIFKRVDLGDFVIVSVKRR